jgi:hypothetical protein
LPFQRFSQDTAWVVGFWIFPIGEMKNGIFWGRPRLYVMFLGWINRAHPVVGFVQGTIFFLIGSIHDGCRKPAATL